MERENLSERYDVLIAGMGVAGLFCALHLPESARVLVLSKDGAEKSDSFLAQGGICVLKIPCARDIMRTTPRPWSR